MISEHHEALAALHALGLLEGEERRAFESELAANAELTALVDALIAAAADLATTPAPLTPPDTLRARVLAALPADAPVIPLWRTLAPWGLAAALAVSTSWLAFENFSLQSRYATLQRERDLGAMAYQQATAQHAEKSLLAETMIKDLGLRLRRSEDLARLKVSALASLAGNTKEALAIAVWDPDQQAGLLTLDRMPAIAESQDYQIWVVDPAYPNPVNGGVFHMAEDGSVTLAFKPDQPVTQATAFAISLEKKGGVPKAEGPIVLLGKLPQL